MIAALRLGGRPCGERRRAFRLAEADEYLCMRPRPLEAFGVRAKTYASYERRKGQGGGLK